MIHSLKDKLLTGTVKNVLIFTESDVTPEPPYVVIKPENSPSEGMRQFRIIVHFAPNKFDELNKYVFQELYQLLVHDSSGKVFITDMDRVYRLYASGYSDIMTDTTDNTIFMERLFQQPFRKGSTL